MVQGKGYVFPAFSDVRDDRALTALVTAVKDKAQHAVILDKSTSDKLYKDVQSYRLVTVATLVDRLKINGSLARRCLKDLEEKGQIKQVVSHSKMKIYSMFWAAHRCSSRAELTNTQLAPLAMPSKPPAPQRCNDRPGKG